MILQQAREDSEPGGELPALGEPKELRTTLSKYNTHPDGSPMSIGIDRLHGPGFIVEIPTGLDELRQIMVHINDQETAWPVLSRVCRELGWTMLDAESGRKFI